MREAVREADNVSEKVTPIVRIRNLGDNGVDYEVKYWLEDYAKYNDTDALVRQRIWYAFRRAGLELRFPDSNTIRRATSGHRLQRETAMAARSLSGFQPSISLRRCQPKRRQCWPRPQSATSSRPAKR